MSVFVGVDGGATKTAATVVDAEGKTLAEHTAGSSNHNSVGCDTAKANLGEAIRGAMAKMAEPQRAVAMIVLAMAGVDRPCDIKMVQQWMEELFPGVAVRIFNDAVAALASGTLGRLTGIVAICGTGMICYGRRGEREERTYGWGALTDGGSGFSIGNRILKAVWASYDGTGPKTALQNAVQTHLKLETFDALIGWTYGSFAWARIASLAPLAFECADKGDPIALKILEKTAKHLVCGICTVATKLGFTEGKEAEQAVEVVLAGSIHQTVRMGRLVETGVRARVPHATFLRPKVSPATAAALIAKQLHEKE